MYEVLRYFTDLQDNGFVYRAGDTYPRLGAKATKARIAELASSKNVQGVPLIAEKAEPAKDVKPKRKRLKNDD